MLSKSNLQIKADDLLVKVRDKLPLIVNNHCHLQLLTLDDAPELFRVVDGNRAHLQQWLPWVYDNVTVSDSHKFILDSIDNFNNRKAIVFGIFYEGEMIGTLSTHAINWQTKETTIGYWLAEDYQGRGMMTPACQVFIKFCFDQLALRTLHAWCIKGNLRSIAVVQRLGFQKVREVANFCTLNGQAVDGIYFSLNHPTNQG